MQTGAEAKEVQAVSKCGCCAAQAMPILRTDQPTNGLCEAAGPCTRTAADRSHIITRWEDPEEAGEGDGLKRKRSRKVVLRLNLELPPSH